MSLPATPPVPEKTGTYWLKEATYLEIPIKHIRFCQAVGRLAREYGLSNLSGSFHDLSSAQANIRTISFSWDSGRHNAEVGNIGIHAESWLTTRVDESEEES